MWGPARRLGGIRAPRDDLGCRLREPAVPGTRHVHGRGPAHQREDVAVASSGCARRWTSSEVDGTAQGRLKACSTPPRSRLQRAVWRPGKDAARRAQRADPHARGGNLVEFSGSWRSNRKSPCIPADIGFLDEARCSATSLFTTVTPGRATRSATTARACADRRHRRPCRTVAKMAMTLHRSSYLEAASTWPSAPTPTDGHRVELRLASILQGRRRKLSAALPRDVFNAATLGGCKFWRPDLGRLAPARRRLCSSTSITSG